MHFLKSVKAGDAFNVYLSIMVFQKNLHESFTNTTQFIRTSTYVARNNDSIIVHF